MGYFGGSSRFAGDPGFFGTLLSVGRKIGRAALGIPSAPPRATVVAPFRPPAIARNGIPVIGAPGPLAAAQRLFPGGKTGLIVRPDGTMGRRRRRMNAGNPKALRRAIRRTDAFVGLAKSALKNTGFKIVSKSSGKVSRATMDKAVAAAHHRKS